MLVFKGENRPKAGYLSRYRICDGAPVYRRLLLVSSPQGRGPSHKALLETPRFGGVVEGTLVHGFLKMLFSSYMYLHVGKSLLVFEALYGAEAPLTPIKVLCGGGSAVCYVCMVSSLIGASGSHVVA